MIDVGKIKYEVVLVYENGQSLVLNNLLIGFSWEDMDGQMAQRADLHLYNTLVNGEYLTSVIKLGTYIIIYASFNGTRNGVFSGRVWTWRYSSAQNKDFEIIAYDSLIYAQKSKFSFYFSAGEKTSSIIKKICDCDHLNLPVEYLGDDVTHATEKNLSQSGGEFLLNILDNAYKKGARKCVIRWENDKLWIVPKGDNKDVYVFEAGKNVMSTNHRITLDDLVTRVIIRGRNKDETVGTLETPPIDGKTEFGIIQDIYLRSQDTSLEEAKKAAYEIMNERGEPKERLKLESIDLPILRKGHKIKVMAGSLLGYYYVKGIVHDGTERTMSLDVEIVKQEDSDNKNKVDKGNLTDNKDLLKDAENTLPLNWPADSKEVTLWFGQVDNISDYSHDGIDIQDGIAANVYSICNGIVSEADTNYVCLDFKLYGVNYKAKYFNLMQPDCKAGDDVSNGAVIGKMDSVDGKGLMKLSILKEGSLVDPIEYFEYDYGETEYLSHPMATTYKRPPTLRSMRANLTDEEYNSRYINNEDLTGGEKYLNKAVLSYAKVFDKNINDKTMRAKNLLSYNSDTKIATVAINGKSKDYGVSLGNADLKNNRLAINSATLQGDFDEVLLWREVNIVDNKEPLVVRSSPKLADGNKIGKLTKGTIVQIISTEKKKENDIDWVQIQYGVGTGWVAAIYLKDTSATTVERWVNIESETLNMRTDDKLDSIVMYKLDKGTKVGAILSTKRNVSDTMEMVEIYYNQRFGWVASTYLGGGNMDGNDSTKPPEVKPEEPEVIPAVSEVKFVKTGGNLIYSDNPETVDTKALKDSGLSEAYTIKASLNKNEIYAAEFYHIDSNILCARTIGILVHNPSTSLTKKIELLNEAAPISNQESGQSVSCELSENYWKNYRPDRVIQTYDIEPGGIKILSLISIRGPVKGSEWASGRVEFKPLASDMEAMIFFVDGKTTEEKLSSDKDKIGRLKILDLPRADYAGNQTTALFDYNTLKGTVKVQKGTKFYLPMYAKKEKDYVLNDNEYTPLNGNFAGGLENRDYKVNGKEYIGGSGKIHYGNYGMLYDVTLDIKLDNPIKIKVYPNLIEGSHRILFCVDGVWALADRIIKGSGQQYWELELKKSKNLKFVFTGGNAAPLEFEVL